MNSPIDLGSQLSLDSTTLTGSYVAGTVFYGSQGTAVELWCEADFKSGSAIDGTGFKLQGRYTATSGWIDLITTDLSTGTAAVAHVITTVASTTQAIGLSCATARLCFGGLRILAEKTGAGAVGVGDAARGYAVVA